MSAPHDDRLDETRSFQVLSHGTLVSHYKIIEKIGAGGMGVVYKALDTKLDRTVALKFLPPRLLCDAEAKARFGHEAKSASALNHNNITTIYEIDEVEGRCFIAMEYIEGKSIKEMAREGSLSFDEIVDISLQIARGLDAAHKKGVVHRDIKSDNIMVSTDGVVKIMDFGLAKLKGVTKLTKEGTTVGTLQYMSPEQLQGRKLDQRSDIFSSGVVLYEMITGRLPFRGEGEAAVIHSILNETPEPLARYKADVPDSLQRIVEKALSKDKEERYQHADELLADLKREKHASERIATAQISTGVMPRPSKRRFLRILVPAAAACIIALLIFVFEPFRVEIGPGKEASAQENSLAIMYFENMADPEDRDRTAQMLTALLITDLSESEYVRVLSRQRLYDILSLLGKNDLRIIDRTVASQVAEKAGVKWILTGSVLQTEPSTALVSEISDAATGEILASQRVTAEADEDLFSLTDRLSAQIKQDLSVPAQAKVEEDRPVADVTTHSPEAYRYYVEGRDYIFKHYEMEAGQSLRRALEFDSTFAMAYYWLAWLTSGSEQEEMIAKALEYSDNASWKEGQYIKARAARLSEEPESAIERLESILGRYPDEKQALEVLGWIHYHDLKQYEQAAFYYESVIEIDPLHKDAYNELAYTYDKMGDFEKSIWAISKYIELAPDEANPYDTRGDLYRYHGDLDLAIESYKKASEIRPDFSLGKLGHMYLFKREYAKAESCYQKRCTSSEKDTRSWGRIYLAYIPFHQGKFKEALRVADEGIAADRMEKTEGWCNLYKLGVKILIYEETDLNLALRECERYMEITHRVYPDDVEYGRNWYAELLAKNGEIVRAEEVAEALRRDIEAEDESQMYWYWHAAGWIERAKGDLDEAVIHFEKVVEALPEFWGRYQLAKTYLESGRLEDAVTELETALLRYGGMRALEGTKAVRAYYLLGLAYEKSGWSNKAIEQYEEFLDIWKDADPGIPEIEDARQRLARLKQTS